MEEKHAAFWADQLAIESNRWNVATV